VLVVYAVTVRLQDVFVFLDIHIDNNIDISFESITFLTYSTLSIIVNIQKIRTFLELCIPILFDRRSELKRSVSVILELVLIFNIFQSKIFLLAVRALNYEVLVLLCFFCHFSNAKSADVVFAARRYENLIEISEANWTAIPVDLSFCFVSGKLIPHRDFFFADCGLYADFVPLSHVFFFSYHFILSVFLTILFPLYNEALSL